MLLGDKVEVNTVEGFTNVESRIYFGAGDPGFPTFDDNDNSGILTYVSMRHGGEIIGANNEINGLTLCSVGKGTTIHHIEVVSNLDDGIEFFGGTVDVKYASVLFNDDDGFDWDLGWSGRDQGEAGTRLIGSPRRGTWRQGPLPGPLTG